jgi:hypothetical protein
MKVFLDDVRFGNEYDLGSRWYEWVVVRTLANCKILLDAGIVTEMSLDYSLADTDPYHTGEDVLQYILEKIESEGFEAPYISIHSEHSGAEKMGELLKCIKQKTITRVDMSITKEVKNDD